MGNIDPKYATQLALERLQRGTAEDLSKFADTATSIVRMQIRELSVARRVIAPESVTPSELEREEDSEMLKKIIDIEPDTAAMQMTLRGKAEYKYIEGKKFAVYMTKFSSNEFAKEVLELMSYTAPLEKIIEENTTKDLQTAEDKFFFNGVKTGIKETGKTFIDSSTTGLTKAGLANTFKLINSNKLRATRMVINAADFDDVLGWDSTYLGTDLTSKVTVDGYTYEKFMGKDLIITIKSDIVIPGHVYIFTDSDYLGWSGILGDVEFQIEKKGGRVSWLTWEYAGYGVKNINAMARYKLASAANDDIIDA